MCHTEPGEVFWRFFTFVQNDIGKYYFFAAIAWFAVIAIII